MNYFSNMNVEKFSVGGLAITSISVNFTMFDALVFNTLNLQNRRRLAIT